MAKNWGKLASNFKSLYSPDSLTKLPKSDKQRMLKKPIVSIPDFIAALKEGERKSYGDLVKALDVKNLDLDELGTWSEECYTRNCLICNDDFELILICWEKGQITPIHDHGGEECWVKVIQGSFKETIYKVNERGEPSQVKSITADAGGISYMVDFMGCHRLENISNDRAMSLHLYAKPILTCNVFDEDVSQFKSKDMDYDTVFEKPLV